MSDTPPKQIIDAAPEDSVLIEARSGSTFNDGGSWHTAIFLDPYGEYWRVRMETDYRQNDLVVERVREVETRTIHYEVIK